MLLVIMAPVAIVKKDVVSSIVVVSSVDDDYGTSGNSEKDVVCGQQCCW